MDQLEISREGEERPVSVEQMRMHRVLEDAGIRPASRSGVRTDRVAVPSRGGFAASFRRLFS